MVVTEPAVPSAVLLIKLGSKLYPNVANAQQRTYLLYAESFAIKPKSGKRKLVLLAGSGSYLKRARVF